MDLIDRQQAIDELGTCDFYIDNTVEIIKDETMLFEQSVISMLKELPSAESELVTNLQPSCNQLATDCISRQAAIELVDWYQHEFCECDYAFGELANELSKLPSAQTEYTIEKQESDIDKAMKLVRDARVTILPSAQPEIKCDSCRYNDLEWDQEPCDSCTVVGENCHYKPSAQPELDEWCHDCKEYDSEKHCCPRFNRVIKSALKDAEPEIVRCKDCQYMETYSDGVSAFYYCNTTDCDTKLDGYCHRAKRRTDEL